MNRVIKFRTLNTMTQLSHRSFRNFGHGRHPTPLVTVLWHGFLTFTFIGLGIEWKKMKNLLFGDSAATEETELNIKTSS